MAPKKESQEKGETYKSPVRDTSNLKKPPRKELTIQKLEAQTVQPRRADLGEIKNPPPGKKG